mgnify:FL=1
MRLGETSDRVVTDAPTARNIDITPRNRRTLFVVRSLWSEMQWVLFLLY